MFWNSICYILRFLLLYPKTPCDKILKPCCSLKLPPPHFETPFVTCWLLPKTSDIISWNSYHCWNLCCFIQKLVFLFSTSYNISSWKYLLSHSETLVTCIVASWNCYILRLVETAVAVVTSVVTFWKLLSHPNDIHRLDVLRCHLFQRAVMTLRKLEAEKASIQREIEPLLSSKSLGPTTVFYPPKLSTATNKIEDLNALTDLYGKKYVHFRL